MIFRFFIRQIKKRNLLDVVFKIVEVLYGFPLLLFSFFVPKMKNKIVISSHTPFNDNAKYFYLLSKYYEHEFEIIWIAKDYNTYNKIKKYNLKVSKKWSLLGIYHCLTAKFYIYTFNISDINMWTWGRSIKINLWHGIPIKHIEFMAKNGSNKDTYNTRNILSWIFAPYIFVRPNVFFSTSNEMTLYYKKAFRLESDFKSLIIEAGMPRCDMFYLDSDKEKGIILDEFTQSVISNVQSVNGKSFLYMPTWRDYDFLNEIDLSFYELNDFLKENESVFYIKLHPATKFKFNDFDNFENVIVLPSDFDIYTVFKYFDCIISDYSSIYYEAVLLNKEIILYNFDMEEYLSLDRGLIGNYETEMPGTICENASSLLRLMMEDNVLKPCIRNEILERKWAGFNTQTVKVVLDVIKKY